MSELSLHHPSPLALPEPRVSIAIRVATMADLPFMDALQKQHGKALGYFPTKQFEGYIAGGHVLVAEGASIQGQGASEEGKTADASVPLLAPCPLALAPSPLGYIISRDRYLKRDELGVIYQLCVTPGQQRSYIGAALLKAVFERAAYGCRLFCCWCAQDLPANRFWEAMGFVPLAFRGGSDRKRRVHLFWQKRIRESDATTPWWFPSKTESGALRADRLVLPIPPGVHWSDVTPVVLPGTSQADRPGEPGAEPPKRKARSLPGPNAPQEAAPTSVPSLNGLQFARPAAPKRPKAPRPKAKHDPKLIAAARELRDRWTEQLQRDPALISPAAKYDLARGLPPPQASPTTAGARLFNAA